jgi:arylsulfatase A-like enzyme
MRILYIDIDSLRPDHLGCYGYPRPTSPNIDRVAAGAGGVRFDNYYVSDAPCLPSRTAMWSGRFGIHNGVINHGGAASEMFQDGAARGFRSALATSSWMHALRNAGLKTVTISPFGERHAAWHWYANFNEIHNTGKGGIETADEISPIALKWIGDHGREDNWFLHVNFWDPHTPYRAPDRFYAPFKDLPTPAWLTEEVRQAHWNGVGPHSAREVTGYDAPPVYANWPKQPTQIDSMQQVRRMFDGYDAGIRYADEHIGRILNSLADQGVLDETAIIISADHGENLGELNIYGDHQTADQCTSRVPLIVRWPMIGGEARVDDALHYHFDLAATLIELAGGKVPENWDGMSIAESFRKGQSKGRDFLVLSQGAWSCQRSVRFKQGGDWLCMRSYHDGYHAFPDRMLFNLKDDPHEQHDLAEARPEIVDHAMSILDTWHAEMMRTATHPVDPMWTVLREGGAFHTRGHLPDYLKRLRETGRGNRADELMRRHPDQYGQNAK